MDDENDFTPIRGWFLAGGIFCLIWNALAIYGLIRMVWP